MDLRGYEQAKFEFSELLQTVAAARVVDKKPALQDRLQDLLARLAEDRFNLIVAGRFSRGKSSLMNAILGMDSLPTGIVPLTSVITTVSYGTTKRVTLKYQERRLDMEVPLRELPQYVTQQGNPGNHLGIATANIELPADILRRGFYFIDTPGLGSVIAENTLTTKTYLPEADALLLVTGFESPLSEEERAIFSAATQARLPIFVAINKQDLVNAAERDEAANFVQSYLRDISGQDPQDVFPISARDALAAKLSHDAAGLQASGVPALEERLTCFLLEQKRTAFLARMSLRVEELVDDLPFFEGLPALHQRARAISGKYSNSPDDAESFTPTNAGPAFYRSQLNSCEICAAVETRTWDFLARFQYELSTDRGCQEDFSQRSGFCCYHTFEYEQAASPFGTCSGFPLLLERLAASFKNAANKGSDPQSTIIEALATHDRCLLCAQRDKAETAAVLDLSDRLRRNTTTTLQRLSALCLPHLAAIAAALRDAEILRSVVKQQALVLERVAEDMRRFTLKQSAARRHLQTKEEQTAAQRGLLLLAGRRNANFATGQTAISMPKFQCLPALEQGPQDLA